MNENELQAIAIASRYLETAGHLAPNESDETIDRYQFSYGGIDPLTGRHIVRAVHETDLDPSTVIVKGSGSRRSVDLLVDLDAGVVTDVLAAQ